MTQAFDDYFSPREAADRLYAVSIELERHTLDPEFVEELRLISQRFARHLNGLEIFTDRLQNIVRAFQC